MRKSISKLLAAGLSVGLMAGCAGNTATTTETTVAATEAVTTEVTTTEEVTEAETTTEAAAEEVVDYSGLTPATSYVDDKYMAQADMWKQCDDTALAAVMKKAEAGEEITIAVLGGSITQGTISSGSSDKEVSEKHCYADLFFEWWQERFPDTEINTINAGIGATGSYLAVNRVKKDVLDYNPDLVLVEFAVNDSGLSSSRTTYENLLRNILASDSQPAVMCLFMGQTNGSTDQDTEVIMGAHYELPMISYINVINEMMDDGTFTAEQLSGDTVHPSAIGHAITGEILWKYLNNVYNNRDIYGEYEGFSKDDVAAVSKDKYEDGEVLDSDDITPDDYGTFEDSSKFSVFPNDWTSTSGEGGLKFTVTCRNLGVMYYKQTNGKGARYDVYVDGEKVTTLDADFSGGWGNYAESTEVFTSDEEAEHTVEFKLSDDNEEGMTEFTVLALLASH